MKKIFFSIFLSIFIILSSISIFSDTTFAAAVNLWTDNIQNIDNIKGQTIQLTDTNPVEAINDIWISVLSTIKTILAWVMVIYIVYAWIQMAMSMGTNEEQLSSSKRQLWYTVIAFVFINIPWALFNAFDNNISTTIDTKTNYSSWFKTPGNEWNVFMDAFSLGWTLNNDIIGFIEIIISALAIIIIIIAGIKMMTSRWKEENITEAKDKIVWSVVALLLVWFIYYIKWWWRKNQESQKYCCECITCNSYITCIIYVLTRFSYSIKIQNEKNNFTLNINNIYILNK